MLIEFHLIQNHAPGNLNRDDTGSPKECSFGGVKRGRISSQCLKRTIRTSEVFQTTLAGHLGTRTRQLPELVRERLTKSGVDAETAAVAAKKASGFGTGKGTERDADDQGRYNTAQTMFLTEADLQAVTETLAVAIKESGSAKKFEAVKAQDLQAAAQPKGFRPITVDIALFGRMITSEAFRDVEACTQVAHALSTHKVDNEYDYFTAVDDLRGTAEEEEDAGADMIGDVEFNSACYYKYFSIHVDGLIKNLTGESAYRKNITDGDSAAARDLAGKAVQAFLKAAVLTTPSGKQNSFAAHQLPALVLVEVRPKNTPVSYANAFVQPVWAGKGHDLVKSSLTAFQAHVQALTTGFSLEAAPRLLLAPTAEPNFGIADVERLTDLNSLCERLAEVTSHA